jgi:hypothetical protein
MQHDLDIPCRDLMGLQVRRKFFIGITNVLTNKAKALVRRNLGWRYDMEEKERAALAKRGNAILAAALANKPQKEADMAVFICMAGDIMQFGESLAPGEKARHEIELQMCRIVRKLPVHKWQKPVQGFGEKALGIIIGECGNLANYDHEDKLKKRLGLAPFEGKAYSRWRTDGGLTKEQWTDAGYAPRRRAELHSVMEPLFKHQSEWPEKVQKDGSIRPFRPALAPYGMAYYRRRAHTATTHPEWKPIQSHMDGLRVMTQELITDLWSEWRRAERKLPETANEVVPAVTELA